MIVVFPSPLVFEWHFSLTSSGTVSRKEPSKWLSMRLASSGSADSCLSLGGRYNLCIQIHTDTDTYSLAYTRFSRLRFGFQKFGEQRFESDYST